MQINMIYVFFLTRFLFTQGCSETDEGHEEIHEIDGEVLEGNGEIHEGNEKDKTLVITIE